MNTDAILAIVLGLGVAYLLFRLVFRLFIRWTVRLGVMLLLWGAAVLMFWYG